MAAFTVIEIHSGEAVQGDGGPVLFDTYAEAESWADAHLGRGWTRDYAIEPA